MTHLADKDGASEQRLVGELLDGLLGLLRLRVLDNSAVEVDEISKRSKTSGSQCVHSGVGLTRIPWTCRWAGA